MIPKLDTNGDGKVSKVELAAFFVNLLGPWGLIITGLFAPINETLQTTLVSAGLMGSGMTRSGDCPKGKKEVSDYYDGTSYMRSQIKEAPPFGDTINDFAEEFSEF